MAKITVEDVLAEMTAGTKEDGSIINKSFNKKNFTKLLKAMMNDPELKTQVANVKNGELVSVDEISVGEGFRKWVRKVVEKAGVDHNDAEVVMNDAFEFDSAEGIYEFIATAIWLYIERGNMFQLMPKENLSNVSFGIKKVPKKVKQQESRNPITGESLGMFEHTYDEHLELVVKNGGCPKWMKKRKKL